MKTYLIALGANQPSEAGSPADTLRAALEDLREAGATPTVVSRFYHSPCFPPGAGPDYVNAAAVLRSGLDAAEMLALLHAIEARHGRERQQRWGPRTLDLDLLASGDTVLPDTTAHSFWRSLLPTDQARKTPADLVLPHPRMQERAFVLVPLNDVAADWVHPVLGLSVAEMVARLHEEARNEVVPLEILGL